LCHFLCACATLQFIWHLSARSVISTQTYTARQWFEGSCSGSDLSQIDSQIDVEGFPLRVHLINVSFLNTTVKSLQQYAMICENSLKLNNMLHFYNSNYFSNVLSAIKFFLCSIIYSMILSLLIILWNFIKN